jgi:hemin uptake protein HemP
MRTIPNSILPAYRICRKEYRVSAPEKPQHEEIPLSSQGDTRRERVITSSDFFLGHDEVVIRHNGRDYRLRRTRLGKLILTA